MFLLLQQTNQQTNTNMSPWIIALIFILGIIGVGIAAWGAKSGFSWREVLNGKNKKASKVKKILNTRRTYNWTEVDEAVEPDLLIVGVSFKNAVYTSESIPVLLLKSMNFSQTISEFKKNLFKTNKDSKFVQYMKKMKFKKEEIIFIIIENSESVEELDHSFKSWLSIISAETLGLN
ncbi:hypothetical protein [Mycoplasma putrefaciens]|uniref:Transmembrane protein n=1 Tax=Mycoplasma putrefaciens Mput9231 TaxID=1292033 RepID=M9WE22_9MOLU|nr:hypothetical protein [Mycoplasma putrefaciens]AGJ91026.1 Hypothetical protein, predicted transmembrane protein [Mycoplasma putrefaciens Mput9231]